MRGRPGRSGSCGLAILALCRSLGSGGSVPLLVRFTPLRGLRVAALFFL